MDVYVEAVSTASQACNYFHGKDVELESFSEMTAPVNLYHIFFLRRPVHREKYSGT
jgi:hypothetical protein